jgi:hypothetical protein
MKKSSDPKFLEVFLGVIFFLAFLTMSGRAARGSDEGNSGNNERKSVAEPASTEMQHELAAMKQALLEQQKALSAQQKEIETLRQLLQGQPERSPADRAAASKSGTPVGLPPSSGVRAENAVASMVPVLPAAVVAPPPPSMPAMQKEASPEVAPLSLRIGSAYITPVGFMDFTSIWRSTVSGSGIGTNFGSIPYGNTTQGKLTEFRLSAQNSRIGSRVDAMVKGAKVLAYWESDFLGFVPTNAAVSSNSDTFRLRLYWVDVSKDKWEFMGGQSWSMMTPGRKGISPLPGDLFYTQDIDVNYQAGLTWSRDPQFRFVFHPNSVTAMGISLESPEQYIGGSAGGGVVTLPSAYATPYASQLNNGQTTLTVPNLHSDIVAKIAFDPKLPNGNGFHFEAGGTVRTFRVFNPLNNQHDQITGGGGQVNLNLELFKGFRAVTNNYWSDGGGRWIFGQAPDLIVQADGTLSAVHSGSTVSGFEYTRKNTFLYGYYGGVYIGRNSAIDANGKYVGYGYPGSPGSQNRTIQEGTFGFTQTFWKDAKYGALSFMGQYSYLARNPWAVASGSPKNAKQNMVYFNLRYALPGSAPTMK